MKAAAPAPPAARAGVDPAAGLFSSGPIPAIGGPDVPGGARPAVSPAVAARAGVAAARAAVARSAAGQGRSAPTGPLPVLAPGPIAPSSVFDVVTPPAPPEQIGDRPSRHGRAGGSEPEPPAGPDRASGRHHRPS